MIVHEDKISTSFNLIRAWGDAVEQGRNGDKELETRKAANEEMGFSLGQALCIAEQHQQSAVKKASEKFADIAVWHPSHPQYRLDGLRRLKKELDCSEMTLIQ